MKIRNASVAIRRTRLEVFLELRKSEHRESNESLFIWGTDTILAYFVPELLKLRESIEQLVLSRQEDLEHVEERSEEEIDVRGLCASEESRAALREKKNNN